MSLRVIHFRQKASVTVPSLFQFAAGYRTRNIYTHSITPKAYQEGKDSEVAQTTATPKTGLERIPTVSLVTSLAASSVAFLPKPVLSILIKLAKRHSAWVESVPPLRAIATKVFYDTFCIGATKSEIASNVDKLRSMGVRGVILAFGREAKDISNSVAVNPDTPLTRNDPELEAFVQFNKDTIDKLDAGDYLAVRCTGAGRTALRVMDEFAARTKKPGDEQGWKRIQAEVDVFQDALDDICAASHARDIKVLIDAEDTERQMAIDSVALRLMAKFNKGSHATVLSTYQMYLKSGIAKLKLHLEHSVRNNYTLGVKMVRGAFISTEPFRNLVHDTKEDTDRAYDEAVKLLVKSHGTGTFERKTTVSKDSDNRWAADVMLATHNSHSVREALRLYRELIEDGGNKWAPGTGLRSLAFAQLKGMADELSFELVSEISKLPAEAKQDDAKAHDNAMSKYPSIGVYKYSVWGTFQECLLYMVRRAEENKDALSRSKSTAIIMARELLSRMNPFRRV